MIVATNKSYRKKSEKLEWGVKNARSRIIAAEAHDDRPSIPP